jgi:surface antigen
MLVASVAVSASVFAQTADVPLTSAEVGSCRAVEGQAVIDGQTQQTVGRACLQPDGTWQFVQGPDGNAVFYPVAAYPYSDPWYYGPPLLLGASFIFIDRFHHSHYFNHFRQGDHGNFNHGHFGGGAGGFHGGGHEGGGGHRR